MLGSLLSTDGMICSLRCTTLHPLLSPPSISSPLLTLLSSPSISLPSFPLPSLKPVRPIKHPLLEPSLLLTESHSFFQFNFNHEQDIYRRIGWY